MNATQCSNNSSNTNGRRVCYLILSYQTNPYKSSGLTQPPPLDPPPHCQPLMPGIVSAKPHSSAGQKPRSARPKPADNEQGTPMPTVMPGLSKETRAHEHHRQRLKKTTETANLQARKLASVTKQLSLSQPRTSANKVRKGSRSSEDVADVDDVPVYDSNRVEERPELISGTLEVSLAEFVMTRKTRKGIG